MINVQHYITQDLKVKTLSFDQLDLKGKFMLVFLTEQNRTVIWILHNVVWFSIIVQYISYANFALMRSMSTFYIANRFLKCSFLFLFNFNTSYTKSPRKRLQKKSSLLFCPPFEYCYFECCLVFCDLQNDVTVKLLIRYKGLGKNNHLAF